MENVVYKEDKEYPELLKEIKKEAPKQLYYKGDWDKNIFENCLAVVGSRRLTSYGQRIVQDLVGKLAAAGLTIVSGFMYGGDAAAHSAALQGGGRTIAIMPCGIERIHPEYQKKLYDEILKNNGLIISEYKGNTAPALWTYPQRNRIVAGLSRATLVIEAGEKSGSLITANCAKKFKRKIFAVPGQIISSVSIGTNLLIKQGAEMVLSAQDVLRFYRSGSEFFSRFTLKGSDASQKIQNHRSLNFRVPDASQKFRSVRSLENKILQELEREPLGIDELSRNLEIPVSELGTKLSLMQIRGMISQIGNKYYTIEDVPQM